MRTPVLGAGPAPQRQRDGIAITTHRAESVGREIQKEIGDILRTEVDDPLIGFVTITGVKMSADLKHAEVFFSAIGEPEAKENAFKGLKRACKFIRKLIAERLELRYVPDLRFHVDDTPEKAQRIEQILRADPATAGGEAREARSDEPEQ